jgi:nuclear pore complex protein Nup54
MAFGFGVLPFSLKNLLSDQSLGSSATSPQQGGGLFGTSTASQQTGLFGNIGQPTNQQSQQQSGGLFGSFGQSTQPQQQTGGLFGTTTQQSQQQPGGPFGGPSQQPQQQTGGVFGGFGPNMPQSQQQTGGIFSSIGQSTQQQQQQPAFSQTLQQPPTLQLGQGQQNNLGQSQGAPSLWEEGRGLGGQ